MANAAHTPLSAAPKGAAVNRRRLMTFAWAWARQVAWSRRTGKPAQHLSEALKAAWANERCLAAYAARRTTEAHRPAYVVRAEIEDMENRDRLGVPGLAHLSALHAELRAAA